MGFFQPVDLTGALRNFRSLYSLTEFENPVGLLIIVLRHADLLLAGIKAWVGGIFRRDPVHPIALAHFAARLQAFFDPEKIFTQPCLVTLIQMYRDAIDDRHGAVFRFLTMVFFLFDFYDLAEKGPKVFVTVGWPLRIFEKNRVVFASTDQETVGGLEVGA